jgi:hypothetical protein
VLWRTCWGTQWELGEHIGNKEKMKKKSPPLLFFNLKGNKQGTLSAGLGLPIHCMKFLFPNCTSPFLARANTPS